MSTLKTKIKLALAFYFLATVFSLIPVAVLADSCKYTTAGSNQPDQTLVDNCLKQSPIVSDIQKAVDFLSAGVGVVVTAVILVGGIQYIIAGDSPQALQAARQRITNGLIALFAFLFIFAFLQWLIPGGIFQ